jgi:DNA-3-methyladenine glycosylase I
MDNKIQEYIFMKNRCPWAKDDPLIIEYHDQEWGVPIHDDRLLFEFLILESAQAGLRWTLILQKRDNYRKAFDNFEIKKVADYDEHKIEELLNNSGIVRNRLKIRAAVANAQSILKIQKEFGSFNDYIWKFVGGKTIQNRWKTLQEVPSSTKESQDMSKDLKMKGFKFVGPTICYGFMQAVGMVNDHIVDCFRHQELNKN